MLIYGLLIFAVCRSALNSQIRIMIIRYFIYTIIGIVTAAIVVGFFIVGSPQEERLRRFDEQRISDLQYLQSQIIQYWQSKEGLPENLEILRDDLRGVTVPIDPQTGEGYGYEVRGPLTFSLCANFARPVRNSVSNGARPSLGREIAKPVPMPIYRPEPYGVQGGESWEHDAGYTCFERTIDVDFFKPRKEEPAR